MHAIILAGGFGTRLKSAVADVPKPLAPVAGRPFLAWLIAALAGQGVRSVTLSVYHEWQKIRDYFDTHGAPVPIDYAVEPRPLGTGGAMAFALAHHHSHPLPNPPPHAGEGILVMNGDTFVALDYGALFAAHRGAISMALRHVPDTSRYGRVRVERGVVADFGVGLPGEAGLINAGVYVLDPAIFRGRALPDAFSFERDFLPNYLAELAPRAFVTEGYFIDIGIPEDYARACRELPLL